MQVIDAHQHFWKYNATDFDWITDEMAVIKKDFLPQDLSAIYQQNNIDGCIAVQVNQTEEENFFFLNFAEHFNFIKGIVGWIDLQADNIYDRLDFFYQYKKIKGFRHILQGESNRKLMLEKKFSHGISALKKFGFTYDILIFPDQLQYALELVKMFPDQLFVIDHLAKPLIKDNEIEDWKKSIQSFKIFENVYCKISGMVTEADWKNRNAKTFKPYIDVVVETFGTNRIMYGSDWPVCLVAAEYKDVLQIVKNYFSVFSRDEQAMFFGGNAIKFYNL